MNMEKKIDNSGFSLFEVLIALVLLAVGMLGIAHMLLIAHKENSSNYTRQQAVQSAYDMLDRMHANRQAAINGNYVATDLVTNGAPTLPKAPATNCTTSVCSPSELAAYDTWDWLANEVARLPNGCGSVNTAAAGTNTLVTVTVQWDDSPAQTMLGIPGTSPTQFTIMSQL